MNPRTKTKRAQAGVLAAALTGLALVGSASTTLAGGPVVHCRSTAMDYVGTFTSQGQPCDMSGVADGPTSTLPNGNVLFSPSDCWSRTIPIEVHEVSVYFSQPEYPPGRGSPEPLAPGTYAMFRLYDAQNRPVGNPSPTFQYLGDGTWWWVHPQTQKWDFFLSPQASRVLFFFPLDGTWYEGMNPNSMNFNLPSYPLTDFQVGLTLANKPAGKVFYVAVAYGTAVNRMIRWNPWQWVPFSSYVSEYVDNGQPDRTTRYGAPCRF